MSNHVPTYLKQEAINFLFPELNETSSAYDEICLLIDHQFFERHLHCCPLYYLNKEFMAIVEKHHLDLGKKEAIIRNGSLSVGLCNEHLKSLIKCNSFYSVEVPHVPNPQEESDY